jgi:hypothetical protein
LDAASDSGVSDTDNTTNDKNPTFTGTAEAGSTVKILVDGVEKGSGTAQEYNSTGIPTSELADDSYSVTATATNASGGEGLPSDALTITVDTILPDTTIDTGPSDPTNDTTPTFEFSSESGSTFQCRLTTDGETPGSFASCSSGDPFGPLATEGGYTFEVKATDPAGNTGSSVSRAFTLDTTGPRVQTTTPANKATGVSANNPKISATFSEPVKKATVVTNPTAQTSSTVSLVNTATGKRVGAMVSCDADPCNKVTITPKRSLAANTKYKTTVTSGVQNLAGNALDQNQTTTGNQAKVWTFTTRR